MNATVETFYGPSGPYLTRVEVTSNHSIHVFHRGDEDPDPHDHKRAFVTFPLTSYVEEIYLFDGFEGWSKLRVVRAWRPHFRGRNFIHRLIGKWSGERDRQDGGEVPTTIDGAIATLVWWVGRKRETWGFWIFPPGLQVRRVFITWQDYLKRQGRPL